MLSEEEQILVGLSIFGGYCSQEIGEMMRLNPETRYDRSGAGHLRRWNVCWAVTEKQSREEGGENVCSVRMNMEKRERILRTGYGRSDLHDCQKITGYRTV